MASSRQPERVITWRKSSYSAAEGGECVEVADLVEHVGVRDSKAPDVAQLAVRRGAWNAFVRVFK
ncbi:DUF397 domain-containing protein [Streptomyces sp. NPDC026672]|uniref:DUF397 domain-containing protein n=1 Tax=unclassified Streptomyces TaxID=2593676 RepID=UPI0034010E0B